MNVPSHEICQRLIKLHCDLGQSNGADCLDALLKALDEAGLSWSDLPGLFALCGDDVISAQRTPSPGAGASRASWASEHG